MEADSLRRRRRRYRERRGCGREQSGGERKRWFHGGLSMVKGMKLQHRPVFGVTLPRHREKVIFSDCTRRRLCGRWPAGRSIRSVWQARSPNKPSSAAFCPTFGFSGSAFRFATSASETLCAENDVLPARGGALGFCSKRVRLLRHQIVTLILGQYSALGSGLIASS